MRARGINEIYLIAGTDEIWARIRPNKRVTKIKRNIKIAGIAPFTG